MSTLERLTHILQANFDIDPTALTPESRLADLSIDSLGIIEIMFAIEDEFKIVVPRVQGESAPALTTVADLVSFVDRLLAAGPADRGATSASSSAATPSSPSTTESAATRSSAVTAAAAATPGFSRAPTSVPTMAHAPTPAAAPEEPASS